VAVGVWMNALRCLEKVGITRETVIKAGGRSMLDSGYTCVDGRVLAKPGTPLAEGDLMFLRCVRGVQGPLPQGQNTQGPPLAPTHQSRLNGP
jgi:hypothetical protein